MRPAVTALLALLLLTVACGGSSDGGVIGSGGGSTVVAAGFTPDTPNPGDETASMAEASTSGDTVVVEVNVTGADGVFSASLDVTFDPGSVEYLGRSPGDLFETLTGQSPIYLESSQTGLVVLGITSTAGPVDVTGTRSLVRLTFRAIEPGSFDLDFQNNALNNDQVLEIPITWSGGTLEAQ